MRRLVSRRMSLASDTSDLLQPVPTELKDLRSWSADRCSELVGWLGGCDSRGFDFFFDSLCGDGIFPILSLVTVNVVEMWHAQYSNYFVVNYNKHNQVIILCFLYEM